MEVTVNTGKELQAALDNGADTIIVRHGSYESLPRLSDLVINDAIEITKSGLCVFQGSGHLRGRVRDRNTILQIDLPINCDKLWLPSPMTPPDPIRPRTTVADWIYKGDLNLSKIMDIREKPIKSPEQKKNENGRRQ